ncbi:MULTISPECIES: ATP-binding protein [Spirulina sp. CCY15215]|uniref:ATP-binding protein n=1 Tax=Spirulina sp. CCY15215 TaxID=2767591 RepID=UPI0019524897|nr:ATP-binding protein [Spirulina major]
MDVTEVLQFADRLVFNQTGKHLDDVQQTAIRGVWQGKTYGNIADECKHSESYLRDIGYKLWKILSEQLGEDIDKSNFRWTMERVKTSHSQQVIGLINKNVNLCSNDSKEIEDIANDTELHDSSRPFYKDLELSPKINQFYGRSNELSMLSRWIENEHTRLVSIIGLEGVGKTALVRKFVDLNSQDFDAIIWKSIKQPKILDILTSKILQTFNPTLKNLVLDSEEKITKLFNIFSQKKCLIILDNLESLFESKKNAGQYPIKYQNYKSFIQAVAETEHQSCLILISQEKSQEMITLNTNIRSVQILELGNLENDALEILENQGLSDRADWHKLTQLYDSNPLYLKSVISLIKEVFEGNVSEFLNENELILTEDLKDIFNNIFLNLSDIEKRIILEISKNSNKITKEELKQLLSLSSLELVNSLQSLMRRYLVKKIKGETFFCIIPVFQDYIKLRFHNQQ